MRYDAVKVAAILGSVGMVFHLLMCVGWPAYYHNLDASTFEKSDVDSLGGPEWLLKASCENGLKPPTSACHKLKPSVNGRHILVTGGAGFIGSHTVLRLLEQGYAVTVLDNLANSSPESLYRVHQLAGKIGAERNMQLVLMDLLDTRGLHRVISLCGPFDAVIHFAGLKAVGESVQKPLRYYDNNVGGTISLIKAMALAGLTRIIFSSSATVYGIQPSPLSEATPTGLNITNPYGQTKHMIEKILVDVTVSASPNVNSSGVTKTNPWNVVLLRYFNPVGASSSGLIGEQPTGVPNNLMPYVAEVANGKRPYVTVMGTDYETIDGSGERDFIHVIDLADGHLAALSRLLKTERPGTEVFNLGTGKPSSVFQLIKAFERACRCHINVVNGTRRPGDLSTLYSDASKAKKDLNWVAKRTLQEMCADTWRWISKSGNSFAGCVVRRQ